MNKIRFSVLMAGLTLLGSGPALTGPAVQGPRSRPVAVTLDDQFVKIAEQLPGFGGFFFDESHVLNVYVKNADVGNVAEMSALKARAVKTIASVLGKDILAQTRYAYVASPKQPFSARPGKPFEERVEETKILKGDYDAIELVAWRKKLDGALSLKGAVFVDFSEQRNRLVLGIERSTPPAQMESFLKSRALPANAVIIEIAAPVRFHRSLRDRLRPVPGGAQIEVDTGVFAHGVCTLGFNVTRLGRSGFVTNSHCTETRGISNDTEIHQPDDPVFSSNHIGNEGWDPPFFTGGECPEGRRCRYSDAAYVDYAFRGNTVDDAPWIARTSFEENSITLNDERPNFWIVSETPQPLSRTVLVKVGRTTGWTAGVITGDDTCVRANVKGTDITLICQGRVRRIAGEHKMSDKGDSGSPVFQLVGENEVSLHGILWGGPSDHSYYMYSPMAFVQMEVGFVETFPSAVPREQRKECAPYCDPKQEPPVTSR